MFSESAEDLTKAGVNFDEMNIRNYQCSSLLLISRIVDDSNRNSGRLLLVFGSLVGNFNKIYSTAGCSAVWDCYIFFSAPCVRTNLLVLFEPSNRTVPIDLCPVPPIFSRTPSPYSS